MVVANGETLAVDTVSGAVRHLQGPLKDVDYRPSRDGTMLLIGCGDDGTAYIGADDPALCMYEDSGYRQLTHSADLVRPALFEDDRTQLEASWSPDSRSVAVLARERVSPDIYSSGDVYVVDVAAPTMKQIAQGAFADIRGPIVWSPDSTHIAMRNSPRLSIGDQLLVIDAATGGSASLAGGLAPGGIEQYAWAPDSSAVAFTWNDGSANARLYVARFGGTPYDLGPVWPGTLPAWSPDGRWIAAAGVSGGTSSVFITRTVSPDRRAIGAGLRQSDSPAWAPDSQHLAFAGSPTGDFNDRHIFVTDIVGGAPQELAPDRRLAFSPLIAFSGDGRRVFFTADAGPCIEGCPPGYLLMTGVDGQSPAVRLHDQFVSEFLGWLPAAPEAAR